MKCNACFIHYTIFGVDDHECLGVSISHDLHWEKHCNKINKNANKTFGLCLTLSPCSKEVKSIAYQSLVQPQAEYVAEAWNPYNITTADCLEHIQCAAASFVHHDYRHTTSINNIINILGWHPLHNRRLVSQLTMFYKIHYCLFIHIP